MLRVQPSESWTVPSIYPPCSKTHRKENEKILIIFTVAVTGVCNAENNRIDFKGRRDIYENPKNRN